ncbi:protein FAR1-RELATED SEQUENCE 5-like [Silene latifolia]|uniref:protein FAR1-RELATED SEQUENCE 5-like n=1 Tax=Silene latifolia TaxID=37657 RepID=UPI003D76F892
MPGRPSSKKRRKEVGEHEERQLVKKRNTRKKCGNCGQLGHNKKSCKNPTVAQPTKRTQQRRNVASSVEEVHLTQDRPLTSQSEIGDDLPTAPVTEEELCRQVEDIFTQYVGMQFRDMEEAITFYTVYALGIGFDVHMYTTKKWRDGTIKLKLLVCNREGFTKTNKESMCIEDDGEKQERKDELKRVGCKARIRLFLKNGLLVVDRFDADHNHELVSVKDREFQKLSRNISKYHMGLIVANSREVTSEKKFQNIWLSYLIYVKSVAINAEYKTNEDLRNVDGQFFNDRFKSSAETQPGFYFDYDVDEDDSLRRAIWVYGIARRKYVAFGEAVSYDPTYSTNKYSMVFTPFTGVDNRKRSVAFCCAIIAKENHESFKWVFERRNDYQDFLKKLNAIIWDEDLEPDEFDGKWLEIMAQHDVGDVEWFFKRFEHKSGTLVEFLMRFESAMEQQRHNQKRLDNENRHSNPKLSSKMALESDAARVYTHNMFEEFQQEVHCKRAVLADFARRWTKDAYRGIECSFNGLEFVDVDIIDEKQLEMTKLWSEVHETIGIIGGREKEDIQNLTNLIREFKEKLCPSSEKLSKEEELEKLLDCKASKEITILPPKISKNKGSGKRIVSSKSKAIAIVSKPKRMCKNCKQMAHHDERNCPNPFAERPPPLAESISEDMIKVAGVVK